MKKIIFKIIEKLDKIYPKKDQIVFNSFPDYSDNSYALFRYMILNNYCKKYKIIWLSNNDARNLEKRIYKEFNIKIEVKKKNSFSGIKEYLKSKNSFSTHGIFGDVKSYNNKKRINLWHGMPLKAIGFLDQKNKKQLYYQDYLIATSDFFQETMASAFNQSSKKVLVTGQPRNDLLFEKTNFFKKKKIDRNNYDKVIIWMPTYRNSIVGDIRTDGNYNENDLGVVPINKLEELDSTLKINKILLIIKLHPMDILNRFNFDNFLNIEILKSNDLEKIDEQLYPLLGSTDALITDYSSVWIDYEILNKPIFFAINDMEEYKNTRGLVFNDFYKISPYKVIENYKEFFRFIKNYKNLEINSKNNSQMYNEYKDNKNCERLTKALSM